MARIQCKMCGGELNLPENTASGTCEYCGTLITFPKVSDERLENLYNRAEHFRKIHDYGKAVQVYEQFITANPEDSEAYWGLVLSRYGIEYVEDPASHERIPTCHRMSYDSILSDADYLSALEHAGYAERQIYENEAKRIAEIQKGILAISSQEQPFDVFICYKESDDYGRRTKDSVTAQEIYYELTDAGYKVFFARVTLESKLGQQYEPYIFAALNSAKVMLVVGSKKEYFEAVWVRNEWSRYLELMKKDRKRLLIPCYKDMDAYDIPDELSMFQSQDMGKIGFVQDVLRGIQKVCKKEESKPAAAAPVSNPGNSNANALLRRAEIMISTGDFENAKSYLQRFLDQDPENGWGYFNLILTELQLTDRKMLVNFPNIRLNSNFKLAEQFADDKLKELLNEIIHEQEEEHRRLEEKAAVHRQRCADSKKRMDLLEKHKALENGLNGWTELYRRLDKCISNERRVQSNPDISESELAEIATLSQTTLSECGDYNIKLQQLQQKRKKQIKFVAYGGAVIAIIMIIILICCIPTIIDHIRGCRIENGVLVEVLDKTLTEFVIPDGVTSIGNSAFSGCKNLSSVTIPNSVTSIGNSAFSGCKNLSSVTIPNSVTSIGNSAFSYCDKLSSVMIPNSVTSIGNSAFSGCDNLSSVTIPNSVTSIGEWAFSGCYKLSSVTIPNSVTSIGKHAFSCCFALRSVTIPNSVTSIGASAFGGCEKVQISNDHPHFFRDSSGALVQRKGSVLIYVPQNFISYPVPNSVTSIGSGAFSGCSNLRSVMIPNSVTSIGSGAFSGCYNLSSVTIPNSVTSIGSGAFSGCSNLRSVMIPRNCKLNGSFPDNCSVIRRD